MPVMAEEVRDYLITQSTRLIVDCTVGTGGHAETLLKASPSDSTLIGIDLDRDALAIVQERLSRFGERVVLKQMNFRDLKSVIPPELEGRVDALLIDCGISRLQIVTSDRGCAQPGEGASMVMVWVSLTGPPQLVAVRVRV